MRLSLSTRLAGSQGVFAGGSVVLNKRQYIAAVKDLIAACPDFVYSCPTNDWKEEKNQVTATLVVTGTHTGARFRRDSLPTNPRPPASGFALTRRAALFSHAFHHAGAPYTYLPGKKKKIRARLPSKMETPIRCENDPETVTWTYSPQMKVRKMTVEPLPDGRGFSGPAGFYVQMGGNLDPPKLCVVL